MHASLFEQGLITLIAVLLQVLEHVLEYFAVVRHDQAHMPERVLLVASKGPSLLQLVPEPDVVARRGQQVRLAANQSDRHLASK